MSSASISDHQGLLHLDAVNRVYDDGTPFEALKPTSLKVERGEYVAITGSSGSGKSTLLNILGLLDRPSAGTYRVDGTDTAALDDRQLTGLRARIFGFVFQAFHLLAGRTVLDNVELGLLYRGMGTRQRRQEATEALANVGLADRADGEPTRLSGGERQRVAIARALVGEPSVLLCDEPTGNLDSTNTENILDALDLLHRLGQTIIVVTHDEAVAARALRRLHVADGVVQESAPTPP